MDVSKLNQHNKRQAFITDICNFVGEVQLSSEDLEGSWTVFRNAVHSLAVDTLGYRKDQDWFDENDEEIQGLLEDKHCLHKIHHADTNSVSKKAAYNNI